MVAIEVDVANICNKKRHLFKMSFFILNLFFLRYLFRCFSPISSSSTTFCITIILSSIICFLSSIFKHITIFIYYHILFSLVYYYISILLYISKKIKSFFVFCQIDIKCLMYYNINICFLMFYFIILH